MGKLKKKGTSGAAVKYITRNQALKKLQVTLADFRRICILKGVYPREPKNKKKANKGSTAPRTFYYYKDIQFLLHEPLLNHFRDHKAYMRKVTRALAKKNLSTARSLRENRPTASLNHIVRERYPSFIDALRDMDDALCLLFLFATFPVSEKVKSPLIAECRRLTAEFQHYVMRANCLRKVFLSIKGIYYQAEIKGQPITWLVPYQFVQQIPDDVDLRVMLTFLEFYRTLIGFVNFRLFGELNLVYPPKMNTKKDSGAADMDALQIESRLFDWSKHMTVEEEKTTAGGADANTSADAAARLEQLAKKMDDIARADMTNGEMEDTQQLDNEDEPMLDASEFTAAGTGAAGEEGDVAKPLELQSLGGDKHDLFAGRVFYLSREVPRNSLEFSIRACGGQVGWDPTLGEGSPFEQTDDRITHHICDRPMQNQQQIGRIYVQPQWVYDSVNAGRVLAAEHYAPGCKLPAHLSPFVSYEQSDYVPAEAHMLHEDLAETAATADADTDMLSDEEEEQHQMELEAEAAGIAFSDYKTPENDAKSTTNKKHAKQQKELDQVREKEQLATIMMSKKDRQIYSGIRREQEQKEAKARKLQKKKDALKTKVQGEAKQ